MLLELFLEILFSIFAVYGIFMLIYKGFYKSFKECKIEEEKENENGKPDKKVNDQGKG